MERRRKTGELGLLTGVACYSWEWQWDWVLPVVSYGPRLQLLSVWLWSAGSTGEWASSCLGAARCNPVWKAQPLDKRLKFSKPKHVRPRANKHPGVARTTTLITRTSFCKVNLHSPAGLLSVHVEQHVYLTEDHVQQHVQLQVDHHLSVGQVAAAGWLPASGCARSCLGHQQRPERIGVSRHPSNISVFLGADLLPVYLSTTNQEVAFLPSHRLAVVTAIPTTWLR